MQRTGSQTLASHVEFPKNVSTELHNLRHVSPLSVFLQTFPEKDHGAEAVGQPWEGRREKWGGGGWRTQGWDGIRKRRYHIY